MKRTISFTFILAGLGIAFVFISLAVILTKNRFWIRKKISLGAAILSLTAFLSTGTLAGCLNIGITCYKPMPVNQIDIDGDTWDANRNSQTLTIEKDSPVFIKGKIYFRQSIISYRLENDTHNELEKGIPVFIEKGSGDATAESFSVSLLPLPKGGYYLRFFNTEIESQGIVLNEYGYYDFQVFQLLLIVK